MLGTVELFDHVLSVPGENRVGFSNTSDLPQCLSSQTLSDLSKRFVQAPTAVTVKDVSSSNCDSQGQVFIPQQQFLILRAGHVG